MTVSGTHALKASALVRQWRDTKQSALAVKASQQRGMAKAAQIAAFYATGRGAPAAQAASQRQLTDHVRTMIDPRALAYMSAGSVSAMIESILRGHIVKLSTDYVRKMANAIATDLMGASKRMSNYYNSGISNQIPITTSTTTGSFFQFVGTNIATTSTATSQSSQMQAMYQAMMGQQAALANQYGQFGSGSIANNVANTLYSAQTVPCPMDDPLVRDTLRLMGDCSVVDGEACTIKLPDGGVLRVARDGSYQVDDATAKVIYRASRMRDFNPFMNASDKLEAFIDYCGQQGVKKDEMLQLPIQLFIIWLVIEAAKADKEPEPDVKLLPAIAKHVTPHCGACGKFIARQKVRAGILFCTTACFDHAYQRLIPAPKQAAIAA